ncbi:Ephrin_rec_like domain-containing protein [Caenorhabditis elegans]|uniref:Ephrin_rec_like domain-containing protein n=1 Tax=Caenorhabditis elegans TaxID=6239 RepID=A0PD37_CAEEL|nr:Ephrin_rec_like domain-containing protein [Caenorhabditis elegans]CAL69746.1 Ephrin_rec_like domain-containing protein [Caenorhabditis elegans]|eukprot:NP_001076720.1 Uncharacterized protein CELE_Y116A8C.49 [Caenorhabditis elegans]
MMDPVQIEIASVFITCDGADAEYGKFIPKDFAEAADFKKGAPGPACPTGRTATSDGLCALPGSSGSGSDSSGSGGSKSFSPSVLSTGLVVFIVSILNVY